MGARAAPAGRADHEPLLARFAAQIVEELAQLRVGRPVLAEELARHIARDPQLLRQAVLALAVDGAEVCDFGEAALAGIDLLDRNLEDRGRGGRVDVLARLERVEQHRVAAQVCRDAQLDLRVVRGDHHVVRLPTGRRRSSNRTFASCCGALRLNFWPATSSTSVSIAASCPASSSCISLRYGTSIATPSDSMSASTPASGSSISWNR